MLFAFRQSFFLHLGDIHSLSELDIVTCFVGENLLNIIQVIVQKHSIFRLISLNWNTWFQSKLTSHSPNSSMADFLKILMVILKLCPHSAHWCFSSECFTCVCVLSNYFQFDSFGQISYYMSYKNKHFRLCEDWGVFSMFFFFFFFFKINCLTLYTITQINYIFMIYY